MSMDQDFETRFARFNRKISGYRRKLTAACLLLPLGALFTVPTQAQSEITLVSNIGQSSTNSTEIGNPWEIAQGFVTGSTSGGYELASVDARFTNVSGSATLTVTLHKDDPTNTAIATFTNPTSLSSGTLTFTAPANTTLDANTTYYVLFNGSGLNLRSTTSDNEDSGGSAGWSIEDVRYLRNDTTTGAFTSNSDPVPIAVKGSSSTTNTAATGKPTIAGTVRVGDTLTANQGTIADTDGLPSWPGDFTFEWVRIDSSSNETTIADATSWEYTLTADDEDHTIKVKVSFTDDGSNAEGPLASEATAMVAAMPSDGCTPDDLQLIGGENTREGSLQICHNNEWRHVCDDQWDKVDAGVACKQLGFTRGAQSATIHSEFVNLINVAYWLDGVECTGSESKLADCPRSNPWGVNNCRFSERAGVRCKANTDTTAPTVTEATVDGASLVITFDENLAAAANLANSAFTVKKTPSGDSEETVTLTGTPTISDATVTLTLDTAVVSTDGSVKVSYTKPTTGTNNTLKDADDNEVADFADQAVTNITDAANNPATNPAVKGPAQVGMTLTADTDVITDDDGLTGATFTYQWIRDSADITGETGSTYVPVAGDVGKKISVRVNFDDDLSNAEEVTSDETRPVVPAAALNCDAPGTIWCTTLTTGQVLEDEEFEGVIVTLVGYSVEDDIGSLDDLTFTHDSVVYTVTKLVSGGTLDLTYGTTPTLPAGNELTLHVQQVVGERGLTLADGELESDGDWFFEGGALTSDSLGQPFTDLVLLHAEYSNDNVVRQPTEAGTEIAVRLSRDPGTAATGKPTIDGPAQVGMTLTAATDDIMDADGLTNPTFTYQWASGSTDITGETGSTYVPTSSDVGNRIRVRVSFTDDAGNAEELTSDQTNLVVPAAALNCDAPGTIWCTTLTTGQSFDDSDPEDIFVSHVGYIVGEFGDLGDLTFIHDSVEYTVTQFYSGGRSDFVLRTTPTLPDVNALTVHVQQVVGERDLSLANGVLESDGDWFFEAGMFTSASLKRPFEDVALLHAIKSRDHVAPDPTDLDTEIAVRLSVAGEAESLGAVLVSNLDQGIARAGIATNLDHAQGFVTGTALGGYTMTAIGVQVAGGFGQAFSTATLHKDSPTNASVATLSPPVTVAEHGTPRLTAPSGTTLDPDSTYYLVLESSNVQLTYTSSDAEDADGLADWEILDVVHERDKDSTGAFATTDPNALLMAVYGYVGTNIGNSPATGQPGITGTAEVGETLSATLGDIADQDGLPALFPDDYTFQWVRVDADGTSNPQDIPGATSSTYTLTTAERGKRIQVEVSFTDDGGALEGPLTSDSYPSLGTVTVDEIAPTIVSARVKDDVLTVVFDEDLAPAPSLGNGAFTVTKVPEGGSRETVSLSGTPTISGAILTLTLATRVEATDTAIQLDYDQPTSGSGNRLADAAGNEVASFAGQAVTLDLVTVTTWHVYFDQTEYTATEGGAGARVKVQLSAPWKPDLNESLTVPLSGVERYGGASEGDFSGVPENVTFAPGQTEVAFTVIATDDNADDDGESIRFGIASVRPFPEDLQIGRGPGAVRVHLEDNDGPRQVAVSFGARAYTAVEGGAAATVAVRLNKAPGRSVTIPLTTRHANAGDFSGVPENVTFGANETMKSFDVVAEDDTLNDDLSIVTLGFGELPDGVTRGDPSETVVNLEDNDGTQRMLTLRFSAPDTKVRELREGISFRLGVFLNETTNARVPIPLEVTYTGGATADDVAGVPATVLITGREGYVTVRAVDDADIDPDEGFTVTFGDLPAGVEADELADEAHFTILDNDAYPVIDVADGRVQEPAQNAYRYLTFAVTLSQAYDERVEVNYRTRNGTAKAGQDFEGTRETLTFPRRTTTGTAWVKVYGDDHNEGTETFTLELSDPINATLGDHTAIGRIDNTGVMPGAWLSRFGRAASDASIEAIGRRMTDERQGSHLTLGTDGFSRLRSWASVSEDHPLDTSDPRSSQTGHTFDQNTEDSELLDVGALGMTTDVSSLPGTGSQSGIDALVRQLGVPDLRDLLTGSSFFYAPDEDRRVPQWLESASAWGETTVQQFRGNEGTLNLDGELATATLGFDTQHDRWLAGLALSYTEGTGSYARRGKGGALSSSLTTLNPYLRYRLSGRTDVWGILGYGTGALALTPDRADDALQTDLSHAMAAFGGRSTLALRAGDTRRFELAVRSDARLTRTASSTVEGLSGAVGDTGRLRMLLEGTGSVELGRGTLTPTLEAGLRYDGGDAETGAGLEIGGGLGYTTGRLKVHLDTRELLVHQATGYQEWGLSGSVAYTPDPDGRGLNVRLGSSWGNTRSGVQALWSHDPARGLGVPIDPGQRYHADIGYGLRGRALWTPYIGAQAADAGGQTLRLGLKISAGRHADAELELGWQADPHGDTKHGLTFGGTVRF